MESIVRLPMTGNVDFSAECLCKVAFGDNDVTIYHTHTYYELFLVVSGSVTHFINGKTEHLPEGTLVFIRPDDAHSYVYETPESRNIMYINFTFTIETAEMLFMYLSDSFPSKELLSCDMPPKVMLSNFEKKHLSNKLNELNAVNWKDKHALKHRMRATIADIFVRYFSINSKDTETNLPVWFSQLLSEMEQLENFTQGLSRMIDLSNKSREHLTRTFKKYLNTSPTKYINELRINHATNLLMYTNTPVLDICFNCGFQSVSHFYKVFEKIYGVSPLEFKNKFREANIRVDN